MASRPFLGAALLLLSMMMSGRAAGPENWVPARLPILGDWNNPRILDLLKDTPINCLLVPWSAGAEVAAYARNAHDRGIAIVGVVDSRADLSRAAASARSAGLDGLALETGFNGALEGRLSGTDFPILKLTEGVMPRIRVMSDSVTATPTTEPWIDFNGWRVHGLNARNGTRPVWLAYRLESPSDAGYARAIADAAIVGGRWVVAPDDALFAGLCRGDSQAIATWKRISSCLRFYEQHEEWQRFSDLATLGIIQDRSIADADIAAETIKLIARRRIPYRFIDPQRMGRTSFEGLSAVLVIGSATLPAVRGLAVVHQDGASDPEALSQAIADLVGKHNPVRLFNVPSVLPQISGTPDGKSLLIQMVNYASAPAQRITVRVAGAYRTARLFRPDGEPLDLKIVKSGDNVEVLVPALAVSAALLLDK